MDIKNTLSEIFLKVFNLDYDAYLQKGSRDLYGIRLIEDEHCNVINCCRMFGLDHPILMDAIKKKGLIQSVCGYLTDAGKIINIYDLNGDLLFVADTFLKAETRTQYALLFHELCHLIIEAGLEYKHLLVPNAYSQGKNIRKYTQYIGSYENDRWHTDNWFALLFATSMRLASEYPVLFKNQQDAVECSLIYAVLPGDLPMNNIEWVRNNH